jgi:hypothetical protein
MSNIDVTNPGVINVADEGGVYGPLAVNQPITVTTPVGQGLTPTIDGDLASPESANCQNVTANNVVGQVYGTGRPANVFV